MQPAPSSAQGLWNEGWVKLNLSGRNGPGAADTAGGRAAHELALRTVPSKVLHKVASVHAATLAEVAIWEHECRDLRQPRAETFALSRRLGPPSVVARNGGATLDSVTSLNAPKTVHSFEMGNMMRLFHLLACCILTFFLSVVPALAQPSPQPGQKVPAVAGQPPAAPPPGSPAAGSAAPSTAIAPGAPTQTAPPGAPTSSTSPTGPAVGAPAATAAAPTQPGMDGATYAVRLRDLEQRIDDLKEQIRRSHTRLSLLSDTILSGGGAGSRASIQFKNELSSAFRITRVLVVLDGAVQYNKTDQSGSLSEQPEIPIFNGSIPPGDHTVQVLVNLQGNGYGVFSYLRGYKFEVRSSHSFTAVEGKTAQLQVLAYEKGGVTTPLEERPAVRYVEKVVTGLVDGTQPAPAAGAPAQPAAKQ